MLQDVLVYDAKRKDGSYVEETNMPITRLEAWETTGASFLVEKEKSGGHHQKE